MFVDGVGVYMFVVGNGVYEYIFCSGVGWWHFFLDGRRGGRCMYCCRYFMKTVLHDQFEWRICLWWKVIGIFGFGVKVCVFWYLSRDIPFWLHCLSRKLRSYLRTFEQLCHESILGGLRKDMKLGGIQKAKKCSMLGFRQNAVTTERLYEEPPRKSESKETLHAWVSTVTPCPPNAMMMKKPPPPAPFGINPPFNAILIHRPQTKQRTSQSTIPYHAAMLPCCSVCVGRESLPSTRALS